MPLLTDGDPSTVWNTDSYGASLSVLGKTGVGVLLDLGEAVDVTEVEVATTTPGIDVELWAGDESPASLDDLERMDSIAGASGTFTFEVGAAHRYWVVWISALPGGGGGRASIGEVTFRGS